MRWVVKEVAERAGFRNARALAAKTGIHLASMYRIWNGVATRTDLATLDRLCTALHVKPGQLFEHEEEPEILPRSHTIVKTPRSTTKQAGRQKLVK